MKNLSLAMLAPWREAISLMLPGVRKRIVLTQRSPGLIRSTEALSHDYTSSRSTAKGCDSWGKYFLDRLGSQGKTQRGQ